MLRLFAHLWLVMSLLVAPLQYVVADVPMPEKVHSHCDKMEQHAMYHHADHDMSNSSKNMTSKDCNCCDKCKTSCASCIHLSVGLPDSPVYVQASLTDNFLPATVIQAYGIAAPIELRPPKV